MDPIRAENNLDHSIFQNQIPGVISINRLYKLMVHDIHQEQENFKIVKSFISGGIAGALNKTFIAPVERVKYLFVTSGRNFTYRQFFADLILIAKTNGVRNLWRGNSMNICRMFPHSAIDFAVFDFLRGNFYKNDRSFAQRCILFMCGSIAGICALTVTDPLEFVRIRLAMEKTVFTYTNSLNAFSVIYRKQGFLGFYKGYMAAIIGVVIYQGISFSLFTRAKEIIKENDPSLYQKWYVDFFIGAFSAIGQIIAYPLDILRKRMQGQALLVEKGELAGKQNYKELIHDIYTKERGCRGFYKGVTLNLIKAPLASASAWTIKNFINRKLNKFYDF